LGRNTSRARSGAQSEGAPSPGGAAIQRSQSRGMRPCCSMGRCSQRPTTHGAHPSAPQWHDVHRGYPAGIPETACDLGRRVCGGKETAMVQQRSYLAGPWRARRSEGRRSTRRFRRRVWDHAGVPGQAGQPPHSEHRWVESFFLRHIPCGIETQGATPPPLPPHTSKIPTKSKRRERQKMRSRRSGGNQRGSGPCGGLGAPRPGALHPHHIPCGIETQVATPPPLPRHTSKVPTRSYRVTGVACAMCLVTCGVTWQVGTSCIHRSPRTGLTRLTRHPFPTLRAIDHNISIRPPCVGP